jgi:hypothetical protein
MIYLCIIELKKQLKLTIMKRFYSLFFVLALVALANLSLVQAQPKIVFDETSHDFGSFKESAGLQTYTFNFTNKGNAPLILNAVNASCGCTTPEWTRQPVAPGAKGMIKVTYNPAGRPGSFNKSITVQSNADNNQVMLTISGSVQEKEKTIAELYPREIGVLRAEQNHISFPVIKSDESKTEKMELVNDTDKPVVVTFKNIPSFLKVTVEPSTVPAKSNGVPGKSVLTVVFDAKAANMYGFVSNRIYLSLNGSDDYQSSIGVSATIEEDFSSLTPQEIANAPVAEFNMADYDFGDIQQGDKKEVTFDLSNKGKRDLLIRNIRASCGCTTVNPDKNVIAPGEKVPVKVQFDSSGKKGRQSKTVTVITNDPKNPTLTLRISSNIL